MINLIASLTAADFTRFLRVVYKAPITIFFYLKAKK